MGDQGGVRAYRYLSLLPRSETGIDLLKYRIGIILVLARCAPAGSILRLHHSLHRALSSAGGRDAGIARILMIRIHLYQEQQEQLGIRIHLFAGGRDAGIARDAGTIALLINKINSF